jgi:hypothetical protein
MLEVRVLVPRLFILLVRTSFRQVLSSEEMEVQACFLRKAARKKSSMQANRHSVNEYK